MYDWVNADYYFGSYQGNVLPAEKAAAVLASAAENVDTLCRGQISALVNRYGWDALSDTEKYKVSRSVCEEADFIYQYGDTVYPAASEYSLGDLTVKNDGNSSLPSSDGLRFPPQLYARMKCTRFMNAAVGDMFLVRR